MTLPKQYNPREVDGKWYQFWEESGFFRASTTSEKPPFSIVMPPPNVTGVLHMGHALVSTVQDILVRWKRMSGFETLWIPGVDHAGISTQTVVERHLIQTEGKNRRDYSRDAFLAKVWVWKEEKQQRICDQLRLLGSSCDWSRFRFTMDEQNCRSVRTAFKKLFDEGLIVRGDYLVNWDPVTQTALADDEVETLERETSIWTIRYPLAEGEGHICIATTRPETLFGDVAVAVHPDDPRYTSHVGKELRHPFGDRLIPIIADREVEPEFGTGAVKITPAHDPTDYRIGERHGLPILNMLTPDACLNELCGVYQGLSVEEARRAVAEELKERGLVEKIERHVQRVGISYRSKAVIEPYMSKQWFVRMGDFRHQLRQLVESGETSLLPKNWEATYYHWIDNLRDWCISRQLWWGHRIPIWYHKEDATRIICWDGDGVPPEVASAPDEWEQDPDVLDTWFSSALWPFSTLGWPDETPELERFYPNSVLVTGFDILFFWVARMLLMGKHLLGEAPFPEAYLHGLIYGRSYWRKEPDGGIQYVTGEERIRYDLGEPLPKGVDSKWEKLSKSKGNVIDPAEIVAEYGTDAMRMALCASGPHNPQIDLDRRRFEEFKNFANKIWNGARFLFLNLDEGEPLTADALSAGLQAELLALEDHWILATLDRTVEKVHASLEHYIFDRAAMTAYEFYWNDFCSYYLEVCKPVLFGKRGSSEERRNKQRILVLVLTSALRLLHPIAPFITEELFQHLRKRFAGVASNPGADKRTCEAIEALQQPSCMVAAYPKPMDDKGASEVIQSFDLIRQVVYAVRNIRGEMGVSPGTSTNLYVVGDRESKELATMERYAYLISALVRVGEVHFSYEEPQLPFSATAVVNSVRLRVPLPEELRQHELHRLEKEEQRVQNKTTGLRKRLENPAYLEKAPTELVDKSRQELHHLEQELDEMAKKLNSLRN